jgi:creatinine amidohydrolase
MTHPVDIGQMSWTDYAEVIEKHDPVILIPVGALEQHGPHLPLATDALLPEAICREVAMTTNALLSPTIAYGYKSIPRCGGGQHFPGTTSLDASTLVSQLKDIVREFARHGVHKIALVVGHMENQWFVTEACDVALREIKSLALAPPQIMSVGYWEFLTKKTIAQVFGDAFPDWSLEHAGIMETSMMLHLYPQLVKMDRLRKQEPAKFPKYDLWPYDKGMVPESGILNTALGSTAEKGKLFYDEYVLTLRNAIEEAFAVRSTARRIVAG